MRMSLKAVIWVAIIYYVGTCIKVVEGHLDTTYVYHTCTGPQVPPLSNYWNVLETVVRNLRDQTPHRRNYHHTVNKNVNGQGCRGYARCNGNLPAEDCDICLQVADSIMLHECGFSLEAEVSLMDCYISYLNTTII